jgi:uncharacterized membrane protein
MQLALPLHIASALLALPLGAYMLLKAKGTDAHRLLGRIWAVLMVTVAVSSFWLTGISNGWSPVHLLSVWILIAMALAVWFVRKGNLRQHKRFMLGSYLGLVGAGIGALMPGRTLYRFFFSLLA